ncbi:putative RNA polymerase ECF-subfamily sigma factor [Actinoplanes missouriensis 431]|uniref:Putative RNA polymerase ECF-subfamily sigma factor n=1 Tax=Actinoplanes missouriensis (strain ATCC 14538 / DSM 43046 / CBS 188.64 / JCM 3121 / NBRC 102363 / NCIMB 12654 / NRRL B-3342 / UNCC 431) TaxID=512565 RepID=I0HFU1_ACTM4|nr:SigE family RNA polymerase sigma factor [Actinoplanes missouriensis]BAL91878.1 putative RNA polymerase ECF-subfamily sigma factor [Actinoplanes missouriensis 431]
MRDDAFRAYFERHHASLSRLAFLMTGESDVADDLAADALTECWRHWDRVTAADDPAAYGHGILMNLARNWVRRRGRERLLSFESLRRTRESDVSAVLDVRGALRRLPHRRRACVVLRYAFDLPEREVATILGISVGAVKSATSRGAKQLADLLGDGGVARIDGWEAAR